MIICRVCVRGLGRGAVTIMEALEGVVRTRVLQEQLYFSPQETQVPHFFLVIEELTSVGEPFCAVTMSGVPYADGRSDRLGNATMVLATIFLNVIAQQTLEGTSTPLCARIKLDSLLTRGNVGVLADERNVVVNGIKEREDETDIDGFAPGDPRPVDTR